MCNIRKSCIDKSLMQVKKKHINCVSLISSIDRQTFILFVVASIKYG